MTQTPPPTPPEYLEQGGGAPVRPGRDGGGPRRTALVGIGAFVGLAAVGGGVWAAVSFFGTGPQPSEALPASTVGYLSIDLDPSGSQKIEALRTLQKFPAFEDEIGLDTDDDVRRAVFEQVQAEGSCASLVYEDDVEPWLGDRFAVAAVDLDDEEPAFVLVMQVRDPDAAEAGFEAVRDCAAGGEDVGGWAVEGEWAVLAETEDIAREVSDAAADDPLSGDEDYQSWTGETGDSGIASLYVAPEAGDVLAEMFLGGFGMVGDDSANEGGVVYDSGAPEGMIAPGDALEDFEGLAATLRFDDGAVELELASGTGVLEGLYSGDRGDDVLTTFPSDTAAGVGVGFEEGWLTEALDSAAAYGGFASSEELLAELEAESGLSLPEDVEALLGESAALGIGADVDPDAFFGSGDPADLPVAAKVQGDAEVIEAVLEKLRVQAGEDASLLDSAEDDDLVVIGPDTGFRSEVLDGGGLGDTEVYQDVVRESDDASAVFFLNFDAGDDWLVRLAESEGDEEAAENLRPLTGFGMTAWADDEVGHTVLRLTTD